MGAWLNLDHQPETNKNLVSHWTVEMDTIIQITTVSWRHWGHVMIPVRLFRPENGASLSSSPSDEPALISNSLRQVSQRTWRHDRTRGFLYLPRQWGQWTPPNSELCSPTADSSSIPSPSKAERSPKRPKSSSPSSALKSSSPSVPDILQNWTKRNQTEHRCRRAVHLPFFRLKSNLGGLVDGFISQCTWPRNNTYAALLMNVSWHNANLALQKYKKYWIMLINILESSKKTKLVPGQEQ